jgi:hypothetical protein
MPGPVDVFDPATGSGLLYHWLISLTSISARTFSWFAGGHVSPWAPVECGVLEGDIVAQGLGQTRLSKLETCARQAADGPRDARCVMSESRS